MPSVEMTLAVVRGDPFYYENSKIHLGRKKPHQSTSSIFDDPPPRCHGVLVVLAKDAPQDDIEKTKELASALNLHKVAFCVLLTKCDKPNDSKTPTKFAELLAIQPSQVLAVSSYEPKEIFVKNTEAELLVLRALMNMMLEAEKNLWNCKPTSFMDRTKFNLLEGWYQLLEKIGIVSACISIFVAIVVAIVVYLK